MAVWPPAEGPRVSQTLPCGNFKRDRVQRISNYSKKWNQPPLDRLAMPRLLSRTTGCKVFQNAAVRQGRVGRTYS